MNRRRDEPGRVQTVRHEVSLRTLLVVPALLAGLWLLTRLWPVLVLLPVALILAGTLAPALDRLERHRVRRPPAPALLLLALALALTGLGALIVHALAGQAADLVAGVPALQRRLADAVVRVGPLTPLARAFRAAGPVAPWRHSARPP